MKELHNGQRVLVELVIDDDEPNVTGRVAFTDPEGGYCVLPRASIIYAFPFDPPQPPEPAFPDLQGGDVLIADTGGVAVMRSETAYEVVRGEFPVASGALSSGDSPANEDGIYFIWYELRDRIIVVIRDKEAIWRKP